MSLNEKLNKAIQENLPSMAAKEMADYIEQAEKDKKELSYLCSKNEDLIARNATLALKIAKLEAQIMHQDDLDNMKEDFRLEKEKLRIEQNELSMHISVIQRDEAQKTTETILSLVDKVFGHPNVSISTTTSSNGNKYGDTMGTGSTSETSTVEQTTQHNKT